MESVKTFLVDFETDNGRTGNGLIEAFNIEAVLETMQKKYPHLIVTGVYESKMQVL
jgi:hypothetical protein